MMEAKIPCNNGDELDAFGARRFYNWRAGALKAAKRSYRRRCRQAHKVDIADRIMNAVQTTPFS